MADSVWAAAADVTTAPVIPNPPTADTPSGTTTLPKDRFLDRELSWIQFNERVMELAEDPGVPLLERARFCAIVTSNLDEFFMVRVAGLRRRIATGIAVRAASGLLPRQLHAQVLEAAHRLQERQAAWYRDTLLPALREEEIEVLTWSQISDSERADVSRFFRTRVFPVLTPLAVDPSHPFPYISGLSLNLAVLVRNPETETEMFARVKVPPLLPRFVLLDGQRFLPLEELIAAHLSDLFAGMEIVEHQTFRVTRNEDLEVEEDEAENLLDALERELTRRRFGPPVRLEVVDTIGDHMLELITGEVGVNEREVFRLPAPLDLRALNDVVALERDDLKYPRFVPRTSRELSEQETSSPIDVLDVMRERDILLHHPYHSFSTSVQRFLEQAAQDPHVLAIKQTLYRTSGDSPIVDALIEAAENGKQVLAIVEIKARFDEENNILWARKLEEAGVHVVYGVVGLKTHCKLSMVVRDDGDALRRYCHIGTGNYHPRTARVYEDFGLLTASASIGEDVANLFNYLSGYSAQRQYANLLVSPHSVRSGLVAAIEHEAANARAGKRARIRLKCNAIVDEEVIDALYRASQAGVHVELMVRGICALRPGVPGVSENIRVRSVLGRFLEHSRVFEFLNDGEPQVWIGSADVMHRNLDRRVEVLVRIKNAGHIRRMQAYLDRAFSESVAAWWLDEVGVWTRRVAGADGTPLSDLQELTISLR
ncbi:MAG: RNA degradosome polyphosphate kinase [Actinomycetales bacterium]|nr:RNA degradosome polyphosphate kinase [Actinomycetales bacterium]